MQGWKEPCQNRVLVDPHHQSISNLTGGEDIVRVVSDPNCRIIYEFAMDSKAMVTACDVWKIWNGKSSYMIRGVPGM